jgi:RNA polymerase sigma-70 factor (ECF subfamily)
MGSLRDDLERIYDEQEGALFVCALGITGCATAAEDAIQEAFRRLLSLPHRPDALRVYVFRSVRNAAIDLCRNRSRANSLRPTYIFAANDPEQRAGQAEFRARAAEALLRLSDDEREAIVQHLYAGLTFREIAEIRDDSVNTVASWDRRGLQKLRRDLEEP